MSNGWISIHRKIKESWVYKDSQTLHLWLHLLLSANHKAGETMIGNQVVKIPRGSLVTGRKALAKAIGVNESKIERVLKVFEKLDKIEQQTFTKFRLISITNYDEYQDTEQQMNNKRTTDEQQVNTNNKNNNNNKVIINNSRFTPPTLDEVKEYCSSRKNGIDAENFVDHYTANGWMRGKSKVKDWKACIRTWEKNHEANKSDSRSRAKRVADTLDEIAREDIEKNGYTDFLG